MSKGSVEEIQTQQEPALPLSRPTWCFEGEASHDFPIAEGAFSLGGNGRTSSDFLEKGDSSFQVFFNVLYGKCPPDICEW